MTGAEPGEVRTGNLAGTGSAGGGTSEAPARRDRGRAGAGQDLDVGRATRANVARPRPDRARTGGGTPAVAVRGARDASPYLAG